MHLRSLFVFPALLPLLSFSLAQLPHGPRMNIASQVRSLMEISPCILCTRLRSLAGWYRWCLFTVLFEGQIVDPMQVSMKVALR